MQDQLAVCGISHDPILVAETSLKHIALERGQQSEQHWGSENKHGDKMDLGSGINDVCNKLITKPFLNGMKNIYQVYIINTVASLLAIRSMANFLSFKKIVILELFTIKCFNAVNLVWSVLFGLSF
jgi:hypothetical protein